MKCNPSLLQVQAASNGNLFFFSVSNVDHPDAALHFVTVRPHLKICMLFCLIQAVLPIITTFSLLVTVY